MKIRFMKGPEHDGIENYVLPTISPQTAKVIRGSAEEVGLQGVAKLHIQLVRQVNPHYFNSLDQMTTGGMPTPIAKLAIDMGVASHAIISTEIYQGKQTKLSRLPVIMPYIANTVMHAVRNDHAQAYVGVRHAYLETADPLFLETIKKLFNAEPYIDSGSMYALYPKKIANSAMAIALAGHEELEKQALADIFYENLVHERLDTHPYILPEVSKEVCDEVVEQMTTSQHYQDEAIMRLNFYNPGIFQAVFENDKPVNLNDPVTRSVAMSAAMVHQILWQQSGIGRAAETEFVYALPIVRDQAREVMNRDVTQTDPFMGIAHTEAVNHTLKERNPELAKLAGEMVLSLQKNGTPEEVVNAVATFFLITHELLRNQGILDAERIANTGL